jgi:methyl-accepting chemotaxis protein
MKLFPKIVGIGAVGLLAATVITVISIYTGTMVSHFQEEENKYRLFQAEVTAAKNAHLGWLRTITTGIVAAKSELTIGTDGHKCAFGEWYYSKGKEIVQTLPESFQKAFDDIADDHLKIHTLGGDLKKVWNTDDFAPATELTVNQINPTADTLLGKLTNLETLCHDRIDEIKKQGNWFLKNQSLPPLLTLLIGMLILIPYSFLTARGIVKPMSICGHTLTDVAEHGILDANIPESVRRRSDEIGTLCRDVELVLSEFRRIAEEMKQLASGDWTLCVNPKSDQDIMNVSLNLMVEKVNDALRNVASVVQQVVTSSNEVASATQDLTAGSQKAEASLVQISTSMDEISGQTKKNAAGATEARDLALKASRAATEGQEAMLQMTTAMEQITHNSNEIQRVIKVIDDIAFQTNLLALNAAVEAARAGQHGKGFAVVAEEVRNLAARSAKAAKETSELIAKSGHEIEKGDEVATHTAEVLNTIVEGVKQTTDLIAGIATASNEQAQGINQISLGLQQIDSVTQQNTATAEESASAAHEMNSMATNLQQIVGQFKLRV